MKICSLNKNSAINNKISSCSSSRDRDNDAKNGHTKIHKRCNSMQKILHSRQNIILLQNKMAKVNIRRLLISVSDGAGSNETRDPSEWQDVLASLSLSERLGLFWILVARLPFRTFRDAISRSREVLCPP